MIKKIFKQIKKTHVINTAFHYLAYGIARLLISTYRVQITYAPGINKNLMANKGVFYFWHQQIIPGMTLFFKEKATGYCVVSPSGDGKIAGFICQKLGFTVLYGSSNKSPITLLRNSLKALEERNQLCIVGDGSRGPAFQLQPGIRYLAQKGNVPIIFVECSSSRHITLKKSWDQFQIPLPFSTITITIHAPEW